VFEAFERIGDEFLTFNLRKVTLVTNAVRLFPSTNACALAMPKA
jgi:hypothetical protein